MTTKLTVIGAGPGGYVAAIRAAQLGAEVTVIEQENVGGTCLNWGCIPSKIMITTAELLEKFHRAAEYGIKVASPVQADMQRLMERKKTILASQTKGILNLFQHHQITYLHGTGQITGKGQIQVHTSQGEMREVAWDKLIVATGTQPLTIPAFPFDGRRVLSSNHALSLEQIPASILIVGGGVIGCEFACMLSALGAHVSVVEALPRLLPLPSVDEDCSKVLQRELKKRKVKFWLNRSVEGCEQAGEQLKVTIGPSPFDPNPSAKDQKPQTVEVERMLVCIGRQPNSRDVGLETIDVKLDDKGWVVADDRMRTSTEDVYAVGDILGPAKVMLAHVASMEGLVAAENAMGAQRVMRYDAVPGAIFTSPEVATVGLSEAQAQDQGYEVRADRVLFRTLGKAQVLGEIAGEAKMVVDNASGRILGVHLIGPHATDLIAEATLAVKTGTRAADLADTIHAHPTLSEIMLETAFKVLDRGLHG